MIKNLKHLDTVMGGGLNLVFSKINTFSKRQRTWQDCPKQDKTAVKMPQYDEVAVA